MYSHSPLCFSLCIPLHLVPVCSYDSTYYERAVAAVIPEKHLERAMVLNNMGQCYRERGLLMKSRDAFNRALTTLVDMHELLKPIPVLDNPETTTTTGAVSHLSGSQLLQPIPIAEWQNVGTGPGLDQTLVMSSPFGAHINVEHTAFWTLSNLYAVQV